MFERWHWTLDDVEQLDYSDFCIFADAVKTLNERDAEAIAKARGRTS